MFAELDRMPAWSRRRTLAANAYPRFDAILQIKGGVPLPADSLFAALESRRRRAKDAIPLATLPAGTTLVRLPSPQDKDRFGRLQTMRRHLSPLLALRPKTLALIVPNRLAADALYTALIAAAELTASDTRPPPKITLISDAPLATLRAAAATAQANTLARRLTALPPNHLTPAVFARTAKQLAKRHGLRVSEYSAARLAKIGAGAILAVGRGSVGNPPRILRLSYNPRAKKRLALVGKGVCFDTGGVNLKPANAMRGMGKDMAGAATALATICAAAAARLRVGVDAWLALAQNDIGARAYRPDEVITALNKTRIEIMHTDAEGRMILADTLTLACARKPAAVVSLATLTGTMHVALGERMSGYFASDDRWRARADAAATASGERLCHFPMPADYGDALKSDSADIKQCAIPGEADHIHAALFLRHFMTGKPDWLHVDLSAVSCTGGLGAAPGPLTGFGVAWSLELLRAWQ